ncbi:MAG: TVP38/TMEM64 family protein, partial [bacterium]
MKRVRTMLKLLAAVLLLTTILIAAVVLDAGTYLRNALNWIDSIGFWGPFVYSGLYIAVCVFLIPGSILTLGAGAVFGLIRGTLYTSVAATLGATVAFILGRTLLRDWVSRTIEKRPTLRAVDRAVEKEGGRVVFLLRLSPLIPFSISNYVYGLTRVSLGAYVLASFVGMLPGVFVYTYIGSLARRIAELGTGGSGTSALEWALYVLGLIATV